MRCRQGALDLGRNDTNARITQRQGAEGMAKSNMEDGVADAIAATAIISVVLVTLVIWLSGFPS